jgi:Uma2 family endonuclease
MALKMQTTDIFTVDNYLSQEHDSENHTRHELIEGLLHAMSGGSANHERISGNIYAEMRQCLKGSSCEPFGSDMKVRVGDNFFYPDAMVVCNFDESKPYYTESPSVIVEVLSHTTRKYDQKTKFVYYLNIASLQEYVLIEQDVAQITVYRKRDEWRPTHYFLGETFYLDSISAELVVADIYQRVKNDDVASFVAANDYSNPKNPPV